MKIARLSGLTVARVTVAVGMLAVTAQGCQHANHTAVGQAATGRAMEHVQHGRESMDALSRGLATAMVHAGRVLTPAIGTPIDPARVRNRVRDLHDDQTDIGRELAFYPTWFLGVVGADGKAIAGDRTPEDLLAGRDLAAAFPCVRPALGGTPGVCVGDFVSVEGQPPRTYLLAVAPIGGGGDAGGAVQAVVVGAIPFGRLARSIRTDLDLRTMNEGVQLIVGFRVHGRVAPSGSDNDVPALYLVPPALVSRIPSDADARLLAGHGEFVFTFAENGGEHQWGAAVGEVPALGPGVSLVVFRSPLRQ